MIPPDSSPRILLIRRRYLGDVVLLGSFLRNLRLHWPQARIDVMVDPVYAGALALNPDVNATWQPPPRWTGWPSFGRRLRRTAYTHVFNFDNTEGTAALTRLTGAPFRLGLHYGAFRLKFPAAYSVVAHQSMEEHESQPVTEYYLRALAPAGVPVVSREVRLEPRPQDIAEVRRFVGASGPVILVHPGSRSPWRIWPADRFAAVCDLAQDEWGAQVVLVGGPGDRKMLEEIRRLARTHLLALPEALPLSRYAALARLSDVVLCHDSGPMHVAAAVGARVVALYGSQNAVLFQPPGEGHILLQPSLPCTACVAPDRCAPGDSYRTLCVQRLTVDQVFGALKTQLATRAR